MAFANYVQISMQGSSDKVLLWKSSIVNIFFFSEVSGLFPQM